MKKLSALIICLFMLTSCGAIKMVLDFIEEAHTDYPVITYEIENTVDGKYTVTYQLRTGFPDTAVDVEIKKSDDVIYKYDTDWKGTTNIENISVWNKTETLPEKIVYLCEYDGGDVYYVQNNTPLPYGSNISKPMCKIVYDGENIPDFMGYDNSLCISEYKLAHQQETIRKTAEFLQENISKQEIIDIFNKCGYDDKYILDIYRYSGKD
ncbi:MAG: hypothetical protein K2L10_11090 [Ruminococcus sp.]|nr:hypothetical protein [Ruminococcus sp.]